MRPITSADRRATTPVAVSRASHGRPARSLAAVLDGVAVSSGAPALTVGPAVVRRVPRRRSSCCSPPTSTSACCPTSSRCRRSRSRSCSRLLGLNPLVPPGVLPIAIVGGGHRSPGSCTSRRSRSGAGAFGQGDVKLLVSVGLMVGPLRLVYGVVYGALLAGIVLVVLLVAAPDHAQDVRPVRAVPDPRRDLGGPGHPRRRSRQPGHPRPEASRAAHGRDGPSTRPRRASMNTCPQPG